MNRPLLTAAAALLLCGPTAYAQSDAGRSPTINADGTATFTLLAPNAEEVELQASFGDADMQREGDLWTYTTPKPLTSDMHTYHFLVDDRPTVDPNNLRLVHDITDTLNYFFIDGQPARFYQQQDVPHGRVEQRWYPSSYDPDMKQRRLSVYLPPQYANDTQRRFPVLYLLHGTGGDEMAWLDMGRAAQIMDNLIAEGRCQPMIVVMPNGIAELDAAPGQSPYMQGEAAHQNMSSWMGRTEAAFPLEVVPFVEKTYRATADKQHRAIAGLSMGGMHAMAIAANNPDLFHYVGLFSPQTKNLLSGNNIRVLKGVGRKLEKIAKDAPFVSDGARETLQRKARDVADVEIYQDLDNKLLAQFSQPPALYYIAIGRKDPLKRLCDKFRKAMDAKDCPYHYHETEGGHTWSNWRLYLIDFLPRLFNPETPAT